MSNQEFRPIMYRHMLHSKVMVIARTRIEGTWKAYCFPVPGKNHDKEEERWRDHGSQLTEKVARAMFPNLERVPYAE